VPVVAWTREARAVEERKTIRRQRVVILGLLVVVGSMFAGFSIASAVVSNSDGTANACYSSKNGKLRMATTPCKAGKETATTLSRTVPMYARVYGGALSGSKHALSISHPSTGLYYIAFDRNVSACAAVGSLVGTVDPPGAENDAIYVSNIGSNLVEVYTIGSDGNPINDDYFHVLMIC
jgi:hypothetical protein